MRIVAEGCVAEHVAILVEPGGLDAKAPFESIFYRQYGCRNVPEVFKIILEGCAMPGTSYEATEFYAERIALSFKWAEWMIAYNQTICIATELRTGCTILQVIFSIVFGHV